MIVNGMILLYILNSNALVFKWRMIPMLNRKQLEKQESRVVSIMRNIHFGMMKYGCCSVFLGLFDIKVPIQ